MKRWPFWLAVALAAGCANSEPQVCSAPVRASQSPLAKAPRNGAQYGGMAIDAGGISEGAGAPGAAADSGHGVLRIYVILSSPGAGLSGAQKSALASTLSEVKNTGVLQAFLRFYYQDALTSKQNAVEMASKIRADIDSAKGTVTPHLDIIPFIQAGFLGPWGEWWGGDLEGSDFGGDQALRTLKTGVVDALKSAFPDTFIQLRYPRDIATYYADDPQIAFHDDSVLAGDDDGGTFNATKKCALWPDGDPGKQRAWIKERSQKLSSVNSGESSEATGDVSCDALLAYLKEYRIGVFNAQWPQVVTKCAGTLKSQLSWSGPLEPSGSTGSGGTGAGGTGPGSNEPIGTELGCWATDQRPWQLCAPEGCEADRCRRSAGGPCEMYRASACTGSWPPAGYPGEETVPSSTGGTGTTGAGGSNGAGSTSSGGGGKSGGAGSPSTSGATSVSGASGATSTPSSTVDPPAAADDGC